MKLKRTFERMGRLPRFVLRLYTLAAALALMAGLPCIVRADSFEGDDRFKAVRTYRFDNQTITDVLEEISRLEGINLSAEPRIAARHVVVIIYGRPLSATLNGLAGLFGWEWKREGTAPNFSYNLVSTDASRAALAEKGLPKLRELVADEILYEIELFDKAKAMPAVERERRLKEIEAELNDDNWETKPRLIAEQRILGSVGTPGSSAAVSRQALRGATRSDIIQMLAGKGTLYCEPNVQGTTRISDGLQSAMREYAADFYRRNPQAGDARSVAAKLELATLRVGPAAVSYPQLSIFPYVKVPNADGAGMGSFGFGFPLCNPQLLGSPPPVPETAVLAHQASFHKYVEFDPDPQHGGVGKSRVAFLIKELDRQAHFDVVADLESIGTIGLGRSDKQPLARLLIHLARWNYFNWRLHDGISIVRGRFPDMATEVREGRWSRGMRPVPFGRKLFTLDGLAEVAGLGSPERQRMASILDGTLPLLSIKSDTPGSALPLWRTLTVQQKETALKKPGLRYGDLSANQQALFAMAARRAISPAGVRGANNEAEQGEFQHFTLRVFTDFNSTPTHQWLYERGDNAWLVSNDVGPSPLDHVRQAFPDAQPGDLTELTYGYTVFRFIPREGLPFDSRMFTPMLGQKLRAVADGQERK